MTTQNDGGMAFPVPSVIAPQGGVYSKGAAGMSLRDWFAGQALAGLLAQTDKALKASVFATEAFTVADAMLAERTKAVGP